MKSASISQFRTIKHSHLSNPTEPLRVPVRCGPISASVEAPVKLLHHVNSLGLAQEFNGLVPPALIYVEQTELHQTVGHHVVVEPDLLFTEDIHKRGLLS